MFSGLNFPKTFACVRERLRKRNRETRCRNSNCEKWADIRSSHLPGRESGSSSRKRKWVKTFAVLIFQEEKVGQNVPSSHLPGRESGSKRSQFSSSRKRKGVKLTSLAVVAAETLETRVALVTVHPVPTPSAVLTRVADALVLVWKGDNKERKIFANPEYLTRTSLVCPSNWVQHLLQGHAHGPAKHHCLKWHHFCFQLGSFCPASHSGAKHESAQSLEFSKPIDIFATCWNHYRKNPILVTNVSDMSSTCMNQLVLFQLVSFCLLCQFWDAAGV